jgi:hypothetical protein
MIAASLLPLENYKPFYAEEHRAKNWMHYLFHKKMYPDANSLMEFVSNPLTFVTFNYDRCLESYLRDYLMEQYTATGDDVDKAMDKISIIHVHGRMGSLKEIPFGDPNLASDGVQIKQAAQGIKIIRDADEQSVDFMKAWKAIEGAKRVAFLGFGYHPLNIKRLKLSRCLGRGTLLYGTAKGLTARGFSLQSPSYPLESF